jgi:hypothetical protein
MDNFFDNLEIYYGKYLEWSTSPSLLQRFFLTVFGYAAFLLPSMIALWMLHLTNSFCIFLLMGAPVAIKVFFQTESILWVPLIVVIVAYIILIFVCVICFDEDEDEEGILVFLTIAIVISAHIYYLGLWDASAYLCTMILVMIPF